MRPLLTGYLREDCCDSPAPITGTTPEKHFQSYSKKFQTGDEDGSLAAFLHPLQLPLSAGSLIACLPSTPVASPPSCGTAPTRGYARKNLPGYVACFDSFVRASYSM